MEAVERIWRTGTMVVAPIRSGRGAGAEVRDSAGAPLARIDADGTITDRSGAAVLRAQLRDEGRARKPSDLGLEIRDPQGDKLGEARVAKYRFGPRARHITLAVSDTAGGEVARLEPRDKRGNELAVVAGPDQVATARVDEVKQGFLRKSRVYTVALADGAPKPVRPLALATLARYDAMLKAATALAISDRAAG